MGLRYGYNQYQSQHQHILYTKKNVFEKKTLLTRVCNVNRVRWWVLFSLKRQAEMKTMIAENVEYGTTFAHFIAVMKNNTLYFLA